MDSFRATFNSKRQGNALNVINPENFSWKANYNLTQK